MNQYSTLSSNSSKLLKLNYLLQNSAQIQNNPVCSKWLQIQEFEKNLEESMDLGKGRFGQKESTKVKNFQLFQEKPKELAKDLSLYLSLIEKPVNLLFSIDQFLFEFSKKTYQQKKTGEFFQQLKERKKLSLFYGHLTRKQILQLFSRVQKTKGYFSKNIFSLLERRLDVVIFRSGLTKTIPEARQLIKHRKVLVNSTPVTIPSFLLNPGDTISMKSETITGIRNQILNSNLSPFKNKVEQTKTHPKIWSDFYSKFKKILEISETQKTRNQNFQSRKICDLLIFLVCTRIKLRSFWAVKKDFTFFGSNQLFTPFIGDHSKPLSVNQEKNLIVLKWKSSLSSISIQKFGKPFFSPKKLFNFSKQSAEMSYPTGGSLQKKPVIWERKLINLKERKVFQILEFGKPSKNLRIQKEKQNGNPFNLKKRNLTLYRNSFLYFLNSLENSTKFSRLVSLNVKKWLFKKSLVQQNSLFFKTLNFKTTKPIHLEISYNLLTIIYLYSPQRLNFPFSIDLDLIKRSLR